MVWYMGLQQRVAPHTIRLYPRIRGVLVDIDNDARLGPCQVSVTRLLAVAGAKRTVARIFFIALSQSQQFLKETIIIQFVNWISNRI